MATKKSKSTRVELVISVASSIAVAALAAWMAYTYTRLEHMQSSLINKRTELYDKVVKNTDALFSYYFFVGRWRQYTPKDVIEFKRDTDELMYIYQPMFSGTLFKSYTGLMDQFFKIPGDWREVQLRTQVLCRPKLSDEWQRDWEAYFSNEDNRVKICAAYNLFMNRLAKELRLSDLTGTKTILVVCPTWDLSRPCP